MRVLLTGANGHVGANTARALLADGHTVVAFVRPNADLRGLDGLDLSYVYGDVTQADTLKRAVVGCDSVIHTAAVYSWWAKDVDTIIQPALIGTRAIFEAAHQAGIRRIVYTSSTAAIGSTSNPNGLLTVDNWNDGTSAPYALAKTQSERIAWELADQHGIELIALCPGAVLGPYDYRITPSTEVVLGMADGSGRSVDSGLSFVHAYDVGVIHAKALTHGTPNQRYAVVAERATFKELAALVTALTGRPVRHLSAPRAVTHLLATVMELGARITGNKPMFSRAQASEYSHRYQFVDGAATWQAFNHTPRDLRTMVRDTLEWLVQIGKLPPQTLQQRTVQQEQVEEAA